MKIINTETSIWYERYKPQCVEDLILPPVLKDRLLKCVEGGDIPHLGLFSSNPGTGKSSTANAILKDINGEAQWVNASEENGIDVVRGKIAKFASQCSFDDKIKIVAMDEFDNFSQDGQKAFRGFIDNYGSNCKFIFTGNYKEKIIEPLLERMEVYDFNSFKKEDMIRPIFERLCFILDNEGVSYEPKDLKPVINTFYPRIRSMVGALQKFSVDGVFKATESDLDSLAAFDQVMDLVSQETYLDMINRVNKLTSPDNMYSFLYHNAGKYFKQASYPNVVLVIAKYQHMSGSVRDKHLNLSACLTELMSLKGK